MLLQSTKLKLMPGAQCSKSGLGGVVVADRAGHHRAGLWYVFAMPFLCQGPVEARKAAIADFWKAVGLGMTA